MLVLSLRTLGPPHGGFLLALLYPYPTLRFRPKTSPIRPFRRKMRTQKGAASFPVRRFVPPLAGCRPFLPPYKMYALSGVRVRTRRYPRHLPLRLPPPTHSP